MTAATSRTTPRLCLLSHPFLTILYDHQRRLPAAVAESLTVDNLADKPSKSRPRRIKHCEAIAESAQLSASDYRALRRRKFSRGHLAARENRSACVAAQAAVNIYPNIIPQCEETNSGTWNHLEIAIREIVPEIDEATVVSGAIWESHKSRVFHGIDIPSSMYKVVRVATAVGKPRIFAFEVPNHPIANQQALEAYVTSVDLVQRKVAFPLPLLFAAHNARK